MRKIKKTLAEKEEVIRELKSGGVSTAPPLPPLDVESLLEQFQEKYFQARYEIRRFEEQIARAESDGISPEEVMRLKTRMSRLEKDEKEWLQKLGSILELIKEERRKTGNDG
jgi:hypothetical protein